MEKTSILDFIAKLTGSKTENETEERDKKEPERTEQQKKTEPDKTSGDSFMRSYNPFSSAENDRRQITSPRAAKPPKSTIDLKSGKNLASEKKNDGTSDMVRFINRHNALANRIGKK